MVLQFGINMLVPICLMSALGVYLDTRYDTTYWTVLFFFIGAVSGGQNVYRLARRIYTQENQQAHTVSGQEESDCKAKADNVKCFLLLRAIF
jgi:hypothetical protein